MQWLVVQVAKGRTFECGFNYVEIVCMVGSHLLFHAVLPRPYVFVVVVRVVFVARMYRFDLNARLGLRA